eukprot:SAG31_NODE_300_length_18109_cov_47.887285_12_plen_376_part_00
MACCVCRFHGEIYDARLEEAGWDKPDFVPGAAWGPVVTYKGAASEFGSLSLAAYPSVAIGESHAAVSIKSIPAHPDRQNPRATTCAAGPAGRAAAGGSVTLDCAADTRIESISYARYGAVLGDQPQVSGMYACSDGGACYDKKYVPGCIFYVDKGIKYFFRSGTGPCSYNPFGHLTAKQCLALRDGPDFSCTQPDYLNKSKAAIDCRNFVNASNCTVDAAKVVAQACVGKSRCVIDVSTVLSRLPMANKIKADCELASGQTYQLAVVATGCTAAPPPPPAVDYVFDFGQNMAGVATMKIPPQAIPPGTVITLRYAEVLTASGEVNMAWCAWDCKAAPGAGNQANQTDRYISSGAAGGETYTPSFTYHGSWNFASD